MNRTPRSATLRRASARPAVVRRSRRGSAMIFTLIVILVMSISGLALLVGSAQALRMSRTQVNSSVAFNLAESGAERGVLWLTQQSSPPSGTASLDPFNGAVSLGSNGSYQVTIIPAANNATSSNAHYTVRSVGTSVNRKETVEVYTQVGSFGQYAYFTDYETSTTGTSISFKAGDVVDGPAHSNNTSSSLFNLNYNGSTTSIFKDILTASGSSINYSPSMPTTAANWAKIFSNGSAGFKLSVPRIELPDTTDRQKIAAWGAASGFPTTTGVTVPVTGSATAGGIYISGDSTVTFSVDANGNQVITIVQATTPATTTTITVKRGSNQTNVVKVQGTTTTNTNYSGVTNGVIYSSGNITSMSGQLGDNTVSGTTITASNAWTVATDVVNGKNINITNNLTYKTSPNKALAWSDPSNLKAATLGLVGRNVTIDPAAPTNLSIHGVILAGGHNTTDGSFTATNYDTRSTGTLNLIGGVIQKKRGPVGTFNSSTGTISTGYSKNYSYDSRMGTNPPPFFPTTGTYVRLSWIRSSATTF